MMKLTLCPVWCCIDSVHTAVVKYSYGRGENPTNGRHKMKTIKTDGKYFLYNIDGHLELWKGKFGGEYSYRAGYVSNRNNFEVAVDAAEEEMRCLMAEGI